MLKDIIEFLESRNPEEIPLMGFCNPHAYRGDYHDLSFEPCKNTTVSEMLKCCHEAKECTYSGWKGGEFNYDDYTTVWLAETGRMTGQTITPILLSFMFGEVLDPENYPSH